MPIQITREEYEKKFGVKPFLGASSSEVIDTKPAPIKITRAEWNAMQNGQVTPTFGQDTKQDFADMGAGLNQAVGRAGRGIVDTVKDDTLSPADKTVVAGSKAFRGISDFLGEAFIGLGKLALPQSVENRIKEKFIEEKAKWDAAEKTDFRNPEGGALVGQETSQKLTDAIFGAKDDFTDRRENDPRFKKLTDAAGNFALGAADLYGAGAVEKGASTVGKKVGEALPDPTDFKNTVTNALDERGALKRQQDLYNIENQYPTLRKDMNKSSDGNAASRARIADANIWDNVVDTDGSMTTLGKGGAYDQYKAATIDGRESIVRDNLVREGATVNVNELARALKTNVANSGLEGAALASALRGVEREIKAFSKGLSKRTDEFGNIPLEKVQDFKTSTTQTINYKKDNNPTITFKKAKARTYKEIIEDKSNVKVEVDGRKYDIKGMNAELAKYYKDLELIESLDGRKVKGGKLGKYFAQVSGNIIGGAAGGAVGGAPGMAIGTVVGGEAAGFLKGRTMARSLGKGGKGIPSNPVLDAARKEAGLPPVKDLKTPDRAIGAPPGVKKTKEITQVESKIKKNVAQQRTAIKDGNFGLVSELKEIYAYLVIKLKELIKEVKEGSKSQAGFANFTGKGEAADARRFKSKLSDEQLDETIDALMDYDTSPITVKQSSTAVLGGKKDMLAVSEADERLFDLQSKNKTKRLSKAEIEEANKLLIKAGVIADPQSKSLGKRQKTYSPIKNAKTKSISQSSTQPREKNGQFGEKPKTKFVPKPTAKTMEKAFSDSGPLSTKLIGKLEGKTTVSKQFISDLTNSPDLKQAERDLIRDVLNDFDGKPAGDIEDLGLFTGMKVGDKGRIDIDKLTLTKSEIEAAKSNIERGLLAQTDGAVQVYFSPKSGRLEVGNGYHRVVEALERGEDQIDYIVSDVFELKTKPEQMSDITKNRTKNLENLSDGKVNVTEFADKVKARLVPLTVAPNTSSRTVGMSNITTSRYENISLPDELKGNVANYGERVYQSPIKNSAGDVHYSGLDGGDKYFAHSRIEDMADGKTRRVIEAQSDLFQKGRLDREGFANTGGVQNALDAFEQGKDVRYIPDTGGDFDVPTMQPQSSSETVKVTSRSEIIKLSEEGKEFIIPEQAQRQTELSQLQPYRNTWWERIVREEVAQAAKDGKKKLQFPTGETAMKIEGLGENADSWVSRSMEKTLTDPDGVKYSSMNKPLQEMKDDLFVGQEVRNRNGQSDWIITEVLDDGKFKAVPKSISRDVMPKIPKDEFYDAQYKATQNSTSYKNLSPESQKMVREALDEQFDISGKVDTKNPIYRFYEKDMQKYLIKNYGAKRVTDENGVTWVEMNVDPKKGKLPVEAFGLILAAGLASQQ